MITTIERPLKPGEALKIVQDLIVPGRVLDIGCGHRHHTHLRSDTIWLDVDIERHATDPRIIAMDAREVPHYLRRMRFTTILLLDVIEHLTKPDGKQMLDGLESMTQRIIICTPVGELWMSSDMNTPHTHKCGWHPEELEARGYESQVWTTMHGTSGGFFAWK